jgi:hypothetical protein
VRFNDELVGGVIVGFYENLGILLGVVFAYCGLPKSFAHAEENMCSAGEVPHRVASGDMMLRIAERYYCKDGDPTAEPIAAWLADHNGSRIGEKHTLLQPGTLLCLPEHFRGATWEATRCWPEVSGRTTNDKPADDKPVKVVVEIRQAESAVAKTESTSYEARKRDKPSASSKKQAKIQQRVTVEMIGGAFVPYAASTRNDFYQTLGFAGVGAHMTLGSLDIAPRLLFVGSNFGATYNGKTNQEQVILGGGGTLQIGWVIRRGSWRFTPGIEGGFVKTERRVKRTDYPHVGTKVENSLGLSLGGIFFRPEYEFRSLRHLTLALEVGGDAVGFYRANDLDVGVNGRIAGGIGYAF